MGFDVCGLTVLEGVLDTCCDRVSIWFYKGFCVLAFSVGCVFLRVFFLAFPFGVPAELLEIFSVLKGCPTEAPFGPLLSDFKHPAAQDSDRERDQGEVQFWGFGLWAQVCMPLNSNSYKSWGFRVVGLGLRV